jgi:vacuolar-type H+-ATPase subunit D/Vma8
LLESEQTRISSEIAQATHRIAGLSTKLERAEREIQKAIELASVAEARYGAHWTLFVATQSLRTWAKQRAIDAGEREGLTKAGCGSCA